MSQERKKRNFPEYYHKFLEMTASSRYKAYVKDRNAAYQGQLRIRTGPVPYARLSAPLMVTREVQTEPTADLPVHESEDQESFAGSVSPPNLNRTVIFATADGSETPPYEIDDSDLCSTKNIPEVPAQKPDEIGFRKRENQKLRKKARAALEKFLRSKK